jgi:hypothetical protein
MHTLSEWPHDETYKGVQQLLEDGNAFVSAWEKMEDWPIEDLLEYQDELEKCVREILI